MNDYLEDLVGDEDKYYLWYKMQTLNSDKRVFNFNLERMKEVIGGATQELPVGLSVEELIGYITNTGLK